MNFSTVTSYNILTDLYALASVFFIKGIADANSVCDPYLIEEMYQRNDNYTTFQIILDDAISEQEAEDYILNIIQEASFHKLLHIRNHILYESTQDMKQALCHLMDYLYRQGLKRQHIYDGNQPEKMLQDVTPHSSFYVTPKGNLSQSAWHDLLRQYIMQIKLKHTTPIMNTLNEFMAVVLKNKNEYNEAKFLEDERRNFILSGGDIPTKHSEDI